MEKQRAVKEEKQANGKVTSVDLPRFCLYEEASAEQGTRA